MLRPSRSYNIVIYEWYTSIIRHYSSVMTTKNIVVSLSGKSRQRCRLDWAESSWLRWIHVLFWTWIKPILSIGHRRQITDEDLFDVSLHDECGYLLSKLETVWNEQKHTDTWTMIIKTFGNDWLCSGLILVPYIAVKITQALLLKQIVRTINDANVASHVGYLYAVGLGLTTVVQALINQQYYFRATRIGMQVRIALSSLIYKRLLFLPTNALVQTTTGQLVNLVSNDASKFEQLSANFHQLWAAPLEAIVVFILIWYQIGLPTLFAYGVLLLLVPLQLLFSRKFGQYRTNTVDWCDKRVKVINEVLVGCQIVKMYRWEEVVERVVYEARKNELQSIRKAGRIRAMNMCISFAALPLMSLAMFGGSWLMGEVFSADNLFFILSLLANLRSTVTIGLPYAIERLSESRIASKRINQFLNLSKQQTPSETIEKSSVVRTTPGSIVLKNASFAWVSTSSSDLVGINLNVRSGSLVGIIGTIGSSKSSLLAAILGEMSLVEGTRQVTGRIAYVSQIPWIFAGTIRENILFCKPFDTDKYERVLKSCQLIADLRSFAAGDLTMIGEKGVNLSGGQKSRVSLARALYTDADIYLFDDPLAAVDPSVAREIFRQCISNDGLLNSKTRLLVTHQIQFLSEFDHCLLLDQGKIERQGSSTDFLAIEKIQQAYDHHQYHADDKKKRQKSIRSNSETSTDQSPNKVDETSIVKDEISIGETVSIHVWLRLFTAGYGWCGLLLLIILMILGEGAYDASNKWLSIWSSKSDNEQRRAHYVSIYFGLVIGTWALALIGADYFFHLILCGASTFHNRMFKGVLYSSLRFYESNPIGRVLNRFSKDQQAVDELLPMTFFDTFQSLIMVCGSIAIVGWCNPWVLLIFIPIIPIFLWLRRYYLQSSSDLKRLECVSRSPVYALVSSSLSGLMTIRAFRMESNFIEVFIDKVNANTRAFFVFSCSGRWFGLRLDLMACCLTFLTGILAVTLRQRLDPSSVALSLSYCISLTTVFQWAVRQSAETENLMTSAERIDEYSHLPPEQEFYQGQSTPPAQWPTEGQIQFQDYQLRYRPELEPVLKGINFEIIPREKIGIIGRTGAGKSSIFQALFRLTDPSTIEGKILIDGIDISMISLNDLRSILNIIPQSPVLFSNTLRYNLDPFRHHTDDELWDALEAVQLKSKIEKLNEKLNLPIAEYGSNLSVGECQLICVARAILKPSKILLIDEATAHVDTKTDEIIQQILRERFSNQTILTIAHRLNTVVDSDRILVMNDGFVDQYGTPDQLMTKQHHDVDQDNELVGDVSFAK